MHDGSHLPASAYFKPGLFEDDLFMRRWVGLLRDGQKVGAIGRQRRGAATG